MILAGGLLNFHLNKLEVMRLHLFMRRRYLKRQQQVESFFRQALIQLIKN